MAVERKKQALLTVWHRNETNLMRLIQFIGDDFDIYIHVDRKSGVPAWLKAKKETDGRVHVISRYSVNWGGLSIVDAEIALIREALAHGEYGHLHLISGEDIPLVTPDEIRNRLKPGIQYVEHHGLPTPKWRNGGIERIELYWPTDRRWLTGLMGRNGMMRSADIQRRLGIKRSFPFGSVRLFGGSNWVSITQDCAEWILTDSLPRRLLKRLRHTFAPDEIFFQTAILNSPFAESVVNDNLRYMDWGRGGSSPAPLTELHVAAASDSGCIFARKAVEGISDAFVANVERQIKGNVPQGNNPQLTDIFFVRAEGEDYNGVDTYRNLIKEIFRDEECFSFTEITFSASTDGVWSNEGGRVISISLPPKEGVAYLSKLGIIDRESRNVFLQNFCPASPTVAAISRCFPESKIVYVVHDFLWLAIMNGDIKSYRDFIMGAESPGPLKGKETLLRALFQDTRNAAAGADAVVCHNADTAGLLYDFFGISKSHIRMIPMGLTPHAESSTAGMKGKTFLYAGRLTPQKGFDTLLEAARMLESHDPEARIVTVGDDRCYKGPRPRNIIFTGSLPREELLRIMERSDFGVVTSRYEQFGLVGLEMKRAGLPVIASDAYGVRQMFGEGNSIVFPTGSPEALFKAMRRLLEMSSEERKIWSSRSSDDFRRRYLFDDMKDRYLALISDFQSKTDN